MLRHVLSLTIPDVVVELVLLIIENLQRLGGDITISLCEVLVDKGGDTGLVGVECAGTAAGVDLDLYDEGRVPCKLFSHSSSRSCSLLYI